MMHSVSSHRAVMLILITLAAGCGRGSKERANDLYVAARKAEAVEDWVLAYKKYEDIVDNYSTTDTAVMVMRESTLDRIRPLAERQTKERKAREAFVNTATSRGLSEAEFVRTLVKEAQQFQAEGDLEHAKSDRERGFFDWSCFSAQQAAEKAVKAVFQKMGAEAWGHSVADLLAELTKSHPVPGDLMDAAMELDKAYIPTRYPNAHPSGSPRYRYVSREAERLIKYAEEILAFCAGLLSTV